MRRSPALLVTLLALLASACPGTPPPAAPVKKTEAPPAPAEEKVVWKVSKSGLGFRLSDADPERPTRAKSAPATPLAAADANRLIAKLPPFKGAAEKKTLALREKSMPAPRPGETVKTAFPPPLAAPPATPAPKGPVSVTRFQPEGEVSMAPSLSVTFSEPMVELTSHDDLAKKAPPVRLSPEPPGRWRWVGTQTLIFEPKDERLPMATEYQVEVPAGTRSANGQSFAQAKSWRFATPPVDVQSFYPGDWGEPSELEPLIYATFDQRIDKGAILGAFALRAGGSSFPVRLAHDEEIEGSQAARQARDRAKKDRFVAFKPQSPLPKNTRFDAVFKAGTPSAEGKRLAPKDQTFHFRTYGPLKAQAIHCGWDDHCPPLAPWTVSFTNPLDAKTFDKRLVSVTPELPELKVELSGSHLTLRGRSKGRTKYKVTIGPELGDKFGQTLGTAAQLEMQVDSAEPYLFPEQSEMIVLDPAFGPKIGVFSINRPNLKVRLYAVTPSEFEAYQKWRRDWDWEGKLGEPPGRLISSRAVATKGAADDLTETSIDLSPALKNGVGQVLAIVEPPTHPPPDKWGYRSRQWVRVWLQVTKMGLTAFTDSDTGHVFATRLGDGTPLGGVDVTVAPRGDRQKTGADGLAKLALGNEGNLLVARQADDLVWLGGGSFVAHPIDDRVRWFVFDDRKLYKPGERVNAKGFMRLAGAGKSGDVSRLPPGSAERVSFVAYEPRGNEIAKGAVPVDSDGGFHFAFDIPKAANLGHARVALEVEGARSFHGERYSHGYEIQEFRKPEFEVTAQASEGPHFVGKHAIATVAATYFAGGGLPDAEVEWHVNAQDASFVPPNRSGYHFGKPNRWSWWSRSEKDRHAREEWKGKTDGGGKHRLRVDFDGLDPAYPRQLDLQATVTDVNRQAWTARSKLLVHPAAVTVGLREESTVLAAGKSLNLEMIVTDLDGAAVAGRPVSVKLERVTTRWRGGSSEEEVGSTETCGAISTTEPVRCNLPTRAGGLHRVTATVTDVHGRPSQTQLELWVLGEDPPENPSLRQAKVELIPGKREYAANDTAEILVVAPFAPAEGVLTVRRDGVVKLERVRLEKRSSTLKVPLSDRWLPNVTVELDLVGAVLRDNERGEPDASLPKRPAFASGAATLKIPPKDRTLSVTITPEKKELEPGGKTRVAFQVRDAGGRPVSGASLAMVAVDESVLALAGYDLPDPIEVFYPTRHGGVRDYETRLSVALMRPETGRIQLPVKRKTTGRARRSPMDLFDGEGGGYAYGSGGVLGGTHRAAAKPMATSPSKEAPPPPPAPPGEKLEEKRADKKNKDGKPKPIAMRSDFASLAAFVPKLTTDGQGRASTSVKLPDNLTRYRIMAVVASGENRFGSGEGAVTARLPLMVRPSAPRFLNFGDRFSLPVVLQNQTASPLSVDVGVRADNLKITEPRALRVSVPAHDRVEVRFPAATVSAGTARLQVGAASSAGDDAAEVELPVWTPATTEAFATYGQIDQGAIAQPIKMPSGVFKEFGNVEVTTSSTALQGLTDALLYLVRYPFECNEQIASRVLSIAALRDVLEAFDAEGLPPPKVLNETVKADLEKLKGRQSYTGGWDYWRRDRQPVPYVSVHVTHALIRAEKAGYPVPREMRESALRFLRNIRSHFPHWYPVDARRVIEAFALNVRWLAKDADPTRARALLAEAGGVDKLPLDALGWLLPVLSKDAASGKEVEQIRRHVDNRTSETAGKAHFVTRFDESDEHVLLASNRRSDAILLEAFIEDRPDSDLIPKVVGGLLGHKKRGRWLSTQENAFVLVALHRYFTTYEKVTPSFTARSWLGSRLASEHRFQGRSTDRKHVDIPLAMLAELPQPASLVLAKEGDGRLYYRLGMQYAPQNLRPPPAEHGFSVSRLYEGAEKSDDVRRDADGTWRIKAGSLVRVRLAMAAQGRRYHVALVDPLPAGLEPLNSALATTGSIPVDAKAEEKQSKTPWWWSRSWYEHQNMRDERVEAFASLLYAGVYDYTYVARATTPGDFVVPPPKAEEMYDPETFGRGAGDRVVVE
ncbi:MAG: Ig-like domain-containing protein [Polyangiaceae bacterium]|nr:Ig-like domain-containing protein [Polyangiaceae bacterium]